jgi:hypothetical protein
VSEFALRFANRDISPQVVQKVIVHWPNQRDPSADEHSLDTEWHGCYSSAAILS